MVLNIHKQKTVLLNLAVVANKFVISRENRVRLFGNLKLSSWVFTVSLLSYYVCDTFVISNTYLNCLLSATANTTSQSFHAHADN